MSFEENTLRAFHRQDSIQKPFKQLPIVKNNHKFSKQSGSVHFHIAGLKETKLELNHFRSGKSRVEFGVKEQYLTEKKLKKKLLSSEWDFPRLKVRSHPDDEKILIRNV